MTHVTCRLTAKNQDQLRNPTLGNRVWATFNFFTSYAHRYIFAEKSQSNIITFLYYIHLAVDVWNIDITAIYWPRVVSAVLGIDDEFIKLIHKALSYSNCITVTVFQAREKPPARNKHQLIIYSVSRKKWAPKDLHWQVQTCTVLNKIKRAVAQKYLGYCRQISYDSIIMLNRLLVFTKCCHKFQLPTWLAYYARRTKSHILKEGKSFS